MGLFHWWRKQKEPDTGAIFVEQNPWSEVEDPRILAQAFEHFPWIFGAVSLIANNCARIPWTVEEKAADGWREAGKDHPAQQFFSRPHPILPLNELLEHTVGHLCLMGNAYWRVHLATVPASLSLLPAHRVKPKIRNHAFAGWEWEDGKTKVLIPAEEMVDFHLLSANSLVSGTSPLKPLTSALLLDHHILAYHREYFQKRTHSAGYFRTDKDLSEASVKRLKAELESAYSGRQGFTKPMILFGGLTFHPLSVPPREMSFAELRQEIRRDILAIFRVPPILLGMDVANYATARIQKIAFWEETIFPLLSKIERTIQSRLIPPFEEKMKTSLRFRFRTETINLEQI